MDDLPTQSSPWGDDPAPRTDRRSFWSYDDPTHTETIDHPILPPAPPTPSPPPALRTRSQRAEPPPIARPVVSDQDQSTDEMHALPRRPAPTRRRSSGQPAAPYLPSPDAWIELRQRYTEHTAAQPAPRNVARHGLPLTARIGLIAAAIFLIPVFVVLAFAATGGTQAAGATTTTSSAPAVSGPSATETPTTAAPSATNPAVVAPLPTATLAPTDTTAPATNTTAPTTPAVPGAPTTATTAPPTPAPTKAPDHDPPPPTAVPPTATAIPPTATVVPPTATAIPPTATAVPPTVTAIPPTATP